MSLLKMKFKNYERESRRFLQDDFALTYYAIALSGETGEFCNAYKKYLRDCVARKSDGMTVEETEVLLHELGDVLFYLTRCAEKLGFSLEDVAFKNLAKLKNRYDIWSDNDDVSS